MPPGQHPPSPPPTPNPSQTDEHLQFVFFLFVLKNWAKLYFGAPTPLHPRASASVTENPTSSLLSLTGLDFKKKILCEIYLQIDGEPEPEVKWLVSGVQLAESDKYHMERHETTYTLTIYEVTVDDTEMTYSCKVSYIVDKSIFRTKELVREIGSVHFSATLHIKQQEMQTKTRNISVNWSKILCTYLKYKLYRRM